MAQPTLYNVAIGEDSYLGTAEEVVAFMMKAEGAPPGDASEYMRGVAERVEKMMDRGPIDTEDAEGFLESLAKHGVARVSVAQEPSDERTDPADLLKGPIAFGPNVDPRDIDY